MTNPAPQPNLSPAEDAPESPESPKTQESAEIQATQAKNTGLASQGTKFLITGVISAVVDFTLTLLFQQWVGLSKFLARSIGFIFGTLTAYMINRRWTFQAAPSGKRLVQVIILYALTYIINAGGYQLIADFLEDFTTVEVASFIAFVIAQGTATVINFFVQRIFIFKAD